MNRAKLAAAALLLGCAMLVGSWVWERHGADFRLPGAHAAQATGQGGDTDLASLQADVEILKQKATDQAHVMVSVAYHFNNLWFAGQHANWPLAQFYLNETRSHLRWAVRVIPVRKDAIGQDIDLQAILEALENSPLKQLEESIQAQDLEKFASAYRFTLDTCYACHKAADKPFLTLRIPTAPAEPVIEFDPAAGSHKAVNAGEGK